MSTAESLADNPLLVTAGYPRFDAIEPHHIVPAVRKILADANAMLEEIEKDVAPNWDSVVGRLEKLDLSFEYGWGPVSHLFGVKNSPELREAYETVLPEVVEFGLRLKQSKPIYEAVRQMKDGPVWETLDEAQRRILDAKLLNSELAGIALEGSKHDRFNEIERELSERQTKFSNNVLDATNAWTLTIRDPQHVEGMPRSFLKLAAQTYNKRNPESAERATADKGPWTVTLEATSYVPFMKHCRNRQLRQEVYHAFVTRASSGEYDNTDLCSRILRLRAEKAELLGYRNYAEVSLAQKMAPDVPAVFEMLERLREASWDAAEEDMTEMAELALASGQMEPLAHWDIGFWSERLRERRFHFTEEELRPYFPHEHVLQGLFELVERLFDIKVIPADGEAPVWNEDVRFFKLLDASGMQLAAFYYDPYSRPENKRPGAWMDDCLTRLPLGEDGRVRPPVAHLVCNCTPPLDDAPSLMTFREVETLFHEFGHGLHHMLTTVNYPHAAGINNVEWDAVELPSQFMENWCYHKPTLLGLTRHYETDERLPEELFDKIKAARTFQAGTGMLRQLTFGITDMTLHADFDLDGDRSIFDVQREIMTRTSVLGMSEDDRFLCSFQHIFAGGYSAGYYSYKWAEVLSADAFAAFEEAGLDDEAAVRDTGNRFRSTILSQGGGRHPMELFKQFRGREPDTRPLLRHSGLLTGELAE